MLYGSITSIKSKRRENRLVIDDCMMKYKAISKFNHEFNNKLLELLDQVYKPVARA